MESTQPGGATGPQMTTPTGVRVKEEDDGDSLAAHSHEFYVILRKSQKKTKIFCKQPCTVLEALKSRKIYDKLKVPDENLIIQMGVADKKNIIATHFPCTCIPDGERLIISSSSKAVEAPHEAPHEGNTTIHPSDKYSVFYIDTIGGVNTKRKKCFINSAVNSYKNLCVYAEKGMTIAEALKRDGRFIDDLSDFTLSENDDPNNIIECTENVEDLDKNTFKMCLPLEKTAKDLKQKENPGPSKKSQERCDAHNLNKKESNSRLPRDKGASGEKQQENSAESNNLPQNCNIVALLDVGHQRAVSVRAAVKKSGNSDDTKIYELLRQQFPALKEWMESRFSDDSFQEILNLRKEDFVKIQQSFSEVHRVEKLMKLGESVCKVVVKDVCTGTGFVLFDNFILTNAHLFESCVEEGRLKEGDVFVLFNYKDPEPHTNYNYFQAVNSFICYSKGELDYAVLELNPEGKKPNQTSLPNEIIVPPGLLKEFAPVPSGGEACIIGHPAGAVKKINPTYVIEKEKRETAVRDQLHPYKDSIFIVHIINQLTHQGIENIMMGGAKAEVATYKAGMYHGSSGSPVFDFGCRVFGLHTAGYTYGFPKNTENVIEYAQPLLTIFEHLVRQLMADGNEQMFKRVAEEAKGNDHLEKVLNSIVGSKKSRLELPFGDGEVVKTEPSTDFVEPMEIDDV